MSSRQILLGKPNEVAHLRGEIGESEFKTHDELGLPLDPLLYAKSSCTFCYGRGTYTVLRAMSAEQTAKLAGGSENIASQIQGSNNMLRSMASCGCAARGYRREREKRQADMKRGIKSSFTDAGWVDASAVAPLAPQSTAASTSTDVK